MVIGAEMPACVPSLVKLLREKFYIADVSRSRLYLCVLVLRFFHLPSSSPQWC